MYYKLFLLQALRAPKSARRSNSHGPAKSAQSGASSVKETHKDANDIIPDPSHVSTHPLLP